MQLFKWGTRYLVSVPEIDAEHRTIFEIADRLDRSVRAHEDAHHTRLVLRELVAHAADHFAHEERLMRSTRCPSYAWHKGQHETIAAEVQELERLVRRGDPRAVQLLHPLAGHLDGHIRLTDRIMGVHLRNWALAYSKMAS